MSKCLNFQRLSSKAGLTITERHVNYMWSSLSILGRFKLVSKLARLPEVNWMLKVHLLKLPIVAPEKKPEPAGLE